MNRVRSLFPVIRLLALATGVGSACYSPGLGQRCDPTRANDCADGLQCVPPLNCLIAVCCPTIINSDSPAACTVCPVDTGVAAAVDATE